MAQMILQVCGNGNEFSLEMLAILWAVDKYIWWFLYSLITFYIVLNSIE